MKIKALKILRGKYSVSDMSKIENLSVLIPVYNYDIQRIAKSLSEQIPSLAVPVEIICLDDGSVEEYKRINRKVKTFPFVRYEEQEKNIGRAKIRNRLSCMASNDHLLFLDCDSAIISPDFLKNYLEAPYSPVLLGGRVYTSNPPEEKKYYLHWLAGSMKEVQPAEVRNKNPYSSLMFNNILVRKKEFLQIQLDENIEGYGHEDTKFGYDLLKHKIPIVHIDNPVLHEGLDDNVAFLDKTKESVKNLVRLAITEKALVETKLLKTYLTVRKSGLEKIIRLLLQTIYPFLKQNLLSDKPSLLFLDLYKLKCFLDKKA